jgi:gamma-glutamyl hercynylcysteine S-oxide synthase
MPLNTPITAERSQDRTDTPSRNRTVPPAPAGMGWMARVCRALGGGGGPRAAVPHRDTNRGPLGAHPSDGEIRGVTQHLISEDRYIFVLLDEAADDIEPREAAPAWNALDEQMALIPGGIAPVLESSGIIVPTEVAPYYLDRFAVTNRQFQRFVKAGGYDNMENWPQEVWPSLMRFTDRTGHPGPRHWENGKFPSAKGEHPVVGVCWFEAVAYARWAGKRLATAAEWQKAGGWPEQISGGSCNRYPWGDIFDPRRANLFPAGCGGTVPVREYATGTTPNGVFQMSGNVWEWLNDPLVSVPCDSQSTLEAWMPLRRIIGGAFDTYFPAEATCQYVTGQPELDRRDNIGFRCSVSVGRLRPRP